MLGISACSLFSNPGNSMSSTTHLLGVLESFWNSPVTEIGSNGNEIASPLVTQLLFPLAPGVLYALSQYPWKLYVPKPPHLNPSCLDFSGMVHSGFFMILDEIKKLDILAACLHWIMIIYLCFRNVETVGLKIQLPEGNVLLVGVNLKKKKKTWKKIHHYVRCHSFNEFAWEMGISSATFDFYQYI